MYFTIAQTWTIKINISPQPRHKNNSTKSYAVRKRTEGESLPDKGTSNSKMGENLNIYLRFYDLHIAE